MATTIGMYGVDLVSNSSAFESGLTKARRSATSWGAATNKVIGRAEKGFSGLRGTINRMGKSLFSLRGLAVSAFAGWGVGRLAQKFVEIGSSMDDLELSQKTVTREGGLSFDALNQWALKMPVTTEKAIEAYKNMRAMGLQPTIEQMTTLVDTTSALGGQSDVMLGIARALGQIQTKGKVSTEELYQLAERGVPAMEILREKLGLTAEQVAEIGKLGIEGGKAVEALMEGMAERFGGMSEQMQSRFTGLWASVKSYFTEFIRLVMKSGVMEFLEEKLQAVVGWADRLYREGRLQDWARSVAEWVVDLGERFWNFVSNAIGSMQEFERKVTATVEWISDKFEGLIKVLNAVLTVLEAIVWLAEKAGAAAGWAYGMAESAGRSQIADDTAMGGGGFQHGTGPAGLPRTGWFYGHQGEIVLNPAESAKHRKGGGGMTFQFSGPFMGNQADARTFATMIKRELDLLGARY